MKNVLKHGSFLPAGVFAWLQILHALSYGQKLSKAENGHELTLTFSPTGQFSKVRISARLSIIARLMFLPAIFAQE